MKKITVLFFCWAILLSAQDMIVRVYVPTWQELKKISDKPLDIAAGRFGEWYDLVVDQAGLDMVIASGLPYEVTVLSLESRKESVLGSYCSYADMVDSLRDMALVHPGICKLDSLPIPTYLGQWIYGVKISDNVNLDEESEPKFTLDGCHHSREWATPQAVLFFADSLLVSYGSVPSITEIVNTTEIYCFPVINVDGYEHDYPGQLMWRKNREPFGGAIGTDCNRNYGGACNGEVDGYWGAADEGQCNHYPSYETFPGAFAFSGDEIWAYTSYIREKGIATGFSLHSYGEQVMYPWGYKGSGTPDAALYDSKGAYMAGMMQRIGGGTYTPGQSYYNPYPTSGNIRDWVYGYNKWLSGRSALFYGSEIGTSFYQSESQLDFISRQVFKAAKYLAGFADSLVLVAEAYVPPPAIHPLGSVGENFVISWHAKNDFDNNPTHWELVELSAPSIITDDLESGTGRWILEGFTLSTAQSHSATHSFFSGNSNDMNSAVRTAHPYLVQAGDSVTFWCWYDLETNWDVAVVEVSENTKEWFCLADRFSGSSGGWIRRAYSLQNWVGRSIYIRFRSMTDGNTLESGFYVDDIYPGCLFMTVDTVSSNIPDTSYAFSSHLEGEYYYYVRGNNSAYGWGEYSCLEDVQVIVGVVESDKDDTKYALPVLQCSPSPFSGKVSFMINAPSSCSPARLTILNSIGEVVRTFVLAHGTNNTQHLVWCGKNDSGQDVSAGVYFVYLETADYRIAQKIIRLE